MKIVMVVNNELPLGLIANTTAVLGVSLGNSTKDLVGNDCIDKDGNNHPGVTKVPIPVLSANRLKMSEIFQAANQNEKIDLLNFNHVAQSCRNYSEYSDKLSQTRTNDIEYSGICLAGPQKEINRLIGSLALLR